MTKSNNNKFILSALSGWIFQIIAILICASYSLRARLALGYWPEYANPDPKTLEWSLHHSLVGIVLLLMLPALIASSAWGLGLLFQRRYKSSLMIVLGSLILLIAYFLIPQISTIDNFLAWYFD